MTIRIVRLGTKRARGEGLRIGTVRRPPRGVPKTEYASQNWYDVWLPNLAPSPELMKIGQAAESEKAWAAFVKKYRAEMANPEKSRILDLLAALSYQTNLSVGCYCENEHRCHRAILKALLAEREATIECVCVRHSTPPTCLFTEIGGDKGSTAGSQKRIFTEDEFMTAGTIYRFSAFSSHPEGGNPAGVWIGDTLPEPGVMQKIAADVGFSETAFIAPSTGKDRTVRYFSPEAEVSFCGHATIAAGVVLGEAEGDGTYRLSTAVGEVPVAVRMRGALREASLTSVAPRHTDASDALVDGALLALGWKPSDLDRAIQPAKAYAGAWHLVLAVADAHRLARLNYDVDRLKTLMLGEGLTTLQLVWRERADVFHSRNPFPVGGVVEDPATGAAAAALGGYLRDAHLVSVPTTILIRQGEAMGRPSRLTVEIPAAGGIVVTGTAVPIEA